MYNDKSIHFRELLSNQASWPFCLPRYPSGSHRGLPSAAARTGIVGQGGSDGVKPSTSAGAGAWLAHGWRMAGASLAPAIPAPPRCCGAAPRWRSIGTCSGSRLTHSAENELLNYFTLNFTLTKVFSKAKKMFFDILT